MSTGSPPKGGHDSAYTQALLGAASLHASCSLSTCTACAHPHGRQLCAQPASHAVQHSLVCTQPVSMCMLKLPLSHIRWHADSALGGSRGDINHLLQYLGHPQYQLPGAYAPARNPNLIPASHYPSSHPLLSPMDPNPTPSTVTSLLGSCSLDGPCTPPQAYSAADDLLWQYRAQMPGPNSAFPLGSRQVCAHTVGL